MESTEKLTSTSVTESAVINAPLDTIWPLLRLKEFGTFFQGIIDTDILPPAAGGNDDRDIIRWTFDEGYTLDVQEEEYSNIKHYMSFNILKCEPWGLPYTSVLSVIRLFPITSGSSAGQTFVQWSGHYSSDASAEVVLDGHVKRREALANLAKAVEK
ncbi:uncharacterized protein TRIVIDRAFT_78735 [Trichoderma virens Gv29-8]|uniref:Bet v I/Major latex protein domain-containing protein n=1 Tax=Hypocrea virens (strain Gv29-8 / FGSC 10586) TaxID=413071 RepID=G9MU02_HYPVG|nr:uncharacterized protein TRIVIDRAFT_78735 [Trichoderma virens Gv29-8]EHK22079.1 hypothetical protein TRIVIDRAFT_78735 [Trichoderma virens Gv29-8]UKZ55870.1 hypothetical protein TrVGV298_009694 [Trichoderma virens]